MDEARQADALIVGDALVDIIDGVAYPAGSGLIVSVGLSRLGVPTVLHTAIGRDASGARIAERAREAGVALSPTTIGDRRTPSAIVTIGPDGVAEYEFDLPWEPGPVPQGSGFRVVHIGCIGAYAGAGAASHAALDAARGTALTSVDLNARPTLTDDPEATWEAIRAFAAHADIVKAGDEDLAHLYPGRTPDEVLREWIAGGALLAVVTRAGEPVLARSPAAAVEVPAAATRVVTTVGAGDSFTAAALAAVLHDDAPVEVLRARLSAADEAEVRRIVLAGTRAAAITVSRPGSDPPWRHELEE